MPARLFGLSPTAKNSLLRPALPNSPAERLGNQFIISLNLQISRTTQLSVCNRLGVIRGVPTRELFGCTRSGARVTFRDADFSLKCVFILKKPVEIREHPHLGAAPSGKKLRSTEVLLFLLLR